MKNLIIAATVLLSMSFVACKKDYRCECSKTRTSGGTSITNEDGSYTFKDTRTRAESRCNDQEGTGSDAFGDYSRDCQIK